MYLFCQSFYRGSSFWLFIS